MEIEALRNTLVGEVVNPILLLLFAVGLLIFVWGLIEFLWGMSKGGSDDSRRNGKNHMLWGIVGMFIMVSAFAIVNVIKNTFPQPSTTCPSGLPPGPGGTCGSGV
jgi:nitrogen fixation-related uncharacterized protein